MALSLVLRSYRDGELAPADHAGVASVLQRHMVEPDQAGWTSLYAGDGGSAQLDLGSFHRPDAFTETVVHVDLLTTGLTDVVYELAEAGKMVIIPTTSATAMFLTDGDQAGHLPAAEPWWDPVTCVDGLELHWRLTRDEEPSPGQLPGLREPIDRGGFLRSWFGLRREY
jgi:hypothetical protein